MPTSARAVRTVLTKICGEFDGSQTGRCGHRPLQTYMKNKQGGLYPQGVCRIRSAPSSLTAAQSCPPLQIERKYSAPPANTQMRSAFHSRVFYHLPARQRFSMGALSPRRRRCSSDLQRDFRVLAAAFFYGLHLWHRGTIRSTSSASFCPLFLARQKKWVCEATAAASPQIRHLR